MVIQAIISDFGGVLYHQPDTRWLQRWLHLLGMDKDPWIMSVVAAPEQSPYLIDVMTGRIPESEVWEMVASRWRVSSHLIAEIRRKLTSRRRLNKKMANFFTALRPRYRTAILSNAGSEARRTFSQAFAIETLADDLVISAEVGLAKPDRRIYELAVGRLGVGPEDTIFVDDLAANVAAAVEFGMHAVHFIHTDQAITEIKLLLNGAGKGVR
jgi:epoxide hydrolase-like predicted phosphatase